MSRQSMKLRVPGGRSALLLLGSQSPRTEMFGSFMALRWEVNAGATLPVAMPWLLHLLLLGMDRLLSLLVFRILVSSSEG